MMLILPLFITIRLCQPSELKYVKDETINNNHYGNWPARFSICLCSNCHPL